MIQVVETFNDRNHTIEYLDGGRDEAASSNYNAIKVPFSRTVRVWKNLRCCSAIAISLLAPPWWMLSRERRKRFQDHIERLIVGHFYSNINLEQYLNDHGSEPYGKDFDRAVKWVNDRRQMITSFVATEQLCFSKTERKI